MLPPGGSPSKTTVLGSTKNIVNVFSRFSSACTVAASTKEPVLDSRSAARSWNGTEASLRRTARRERVRSSSSRCLGQTQETIDMSRIAKPITILYADDDAEDRMLVKDAWAENRLANELHFVEDGEELMDYLRRRGQYTHLANQPLPGMVLLDLNMPRKDGREALQEIKADPRLRSIPVVILTTSKAEEDILRAYDLGVNSFILKPVTFESLVEITRTLSKYWFEVVELPSEATEAA